MPPSLFELFQRGGLVMWPILLSSVVALAIVVERLLTLSRVEIDAARLLEQMKPDLRAGRLLKAKQLCEMNPSPMARMFQAALARYGRPPAEIRERLEEAGSREIPHLERYIPLLGTIAHVAPLMGLLGTVTGLIRCFQTIQEKATSVNPVNPGDLAGGIWEALLTTVFGLIVAIPAYTLYNYLAHRANGLIHELEAHSSELLDFLTEGEPLAQGSDFVEETRTVAHAT